jgi:hypothetical protein
LQCDFGMKLSVFESHTFERPLELPFILYLSV